MTHIATKYSSVGDHRVIHELALPQQGARVDIAAITKSLIGFEIKTANDTLSRLPQQQVAYGLVFDRMFLAVESKHLANAVEVVPAWWGVLELVTRSGRSFFVQRRGSRLNPDASIHALVQLLWRDELIDELTGLGLDHGIRSANKPVLWETLASAAPRHISRRDLKTRVRHRLTNREDWRAA